MNFPIHSKNPMFDPFSLFLVQKYMQKIRLCHAQHNRQQHHAEFQKKQKSQFQKTSVQDVQTLSIGPLWRQPGVQ